MARCGVAFAWPSNRCAFLQDKATAATVSSLQLPGAVPDIEEETEEEERFSWLDQVRGDIYKSYK